MSAFVNLSNETSPDYEDYEDEGKKLYYDSTKKCINSASNKKDKWYKIRLKMIL